jgi:type I restriction enzyme S subunit
VPTIAEQEKIVEILEEQLARLDAVVKSVQTVREKAAQFRRSLFLATFSGAESGGDFDELPAGWALCELGEIAKWGSGGTPKSGVSSYYGGEIPWCVIGDLTESWVSKTEKSLTEDGLKNSSAKVIQPETVMLAMYGASIGRTGIAAVKMATNQAIAFAVPLGERVRPSFLLRYLQSQKDDFMRAGQGGAQPNISQTIIKQWPIPVPPVFEQDRLVNLLDAQLSRLQATLAVADEVERKVTALRRALLHAAFSGELTRSWREANV